MIKVSKVSSESGVGVVSLFCDYELDGVGGRLWFEVSQEFSRYSSSACGDAFFVALTLLAHSKGKDISFETPVSSRLFYGVVEILLPALRIVSQHLPRIRVIADTKNFSFAPIAAGTALSLGVDSFHAVESNVDGPFPITHLTLFNSGAFGDLGGSEARVLFRKTKANVESAAAEMGLPVIAVDSNLSEVLDSSFTRSHSIRNISFALLFPQLFRTFFYASGYPVREFRLDATGVDPTHYDILVAKALSTESLEILIAGLHDERIDKVAAISRFPPSINHLNVCILAESNQFLDSSGEGARNCSRCFKCVKTMAALDVLGALDRYSGVFDLDRYRSERSRYLGWIIYDAMKLRSAHAIEIVREAKGRHGCFPVQAYGHAFLRGVRNGFRKLKRGKGTST